MATQRICSIDGCGKRVKAYGWCRPHYMRWRAHGDPLKGKPLKGEIARFFHEVVLSHRGSDCLIWPYCKTRRGYGRIHIGNIVVNVHRLVCETVHGPAPTNRHEAAHSCGNSSCVNPLHLRWATMKENQADRLIHGTDARGEKSVNAKLTEQDVREIRSLRGIVTQEKLAARFGVARETIGQVQRRRSWAWLI